MPINLAEFFETHNVPLLFYIPCPDFSLNFDMAEKIIDQSKMMITETLTGVQQIYTRLVLTTILI